MGGQLFKMDDYTHQDDMMTVNPELSSQAKSVGHPLSLKYIATLLLTNCKTLYLEMMTFSFE